MSFHQIIKVIKYIEDHFDEEITAEEIENVSHYSYRNIQRIFKKIFGENIISFQRRLRLEKAYKKLIYSKTSISDIAVYVGYGNLQAFSKAFSKQFKISPSKARLNKEKFFKNFIVDSTTTIEVEKIFKDKQIIYYKFIKTNNYNNNEINKIWEEIELKNNKISNYETYGIIVDQPLITEHKNCIYEFAISKISTQNSEFISKEIFGGYYLKFTHYGSFDNIEETYMNFYKYWLNHHLELGDTPVIEHYISSGIDEKEENYVTHIYFPLK